MRSERLALVLLLFVLAPPMTSGQASNHNQVPDSTNFEYEVRASAETNPTTIEAFYLKWSGTGLLSPDRAAKTAAYATLQPGAKAGEYVGRFSSEPLAQTLYLNTTRFIQFDLFQLRRESLPTANASLVQRERYEVLLSTEAGPVGPTAPPAVVFYPRTVNPPRPPQGHHIQQFRIVPLVDRIEAGSVLTLEIRRWVVGTENDALALGPPHQVALAGEARSTLRIPYWPLEEALYRNDGWARPWEPVVDAPRSALLPVAAIAAAALGRRRALVVAVAALAVSGCLGGPSSRTDASSGGRTDGYEPQPSFVAVDDDRLARAVYGTVTDQFGLPVVGAYVWIQGAANVSVTNRWGGYLIRDLLVGDRTVRIDAANHSSFSGSVQVRAGLLTRYDVMLQATGLASVDERSHPHDGMWRGDDRLVWMDRAEVTFRTQSLLNPVRTRCTNVNGGSDIRGCSTPVQLKPTFAEGVPATVMPGTRELEFRLIWTPGPRMGMETMGVVAQRPDGSRILLGPSPPDTPLRMPVGWENADQGHETVTDWRFEVFFLVPRDSSLTVEESVRFTLVLHRGVSPLEPAHPKRFGADGSYDLYKAQLPSSGSGTCFIRDTAWRAQNNQPIGRAGCGISTQASFDPVNPGGFQTLPRPVAMEATWFQAWVEVSAQPTQGTVEWALQIKTAKSNDRYAIDPRAWEPFERGTVRGTRYHYVVCTALSHNDPAYEKRSLWAFGLTEGRSYPVIMDRGASAAIHLIVYNTDPPADCARIK